MWLICTFWQSIALDYIFYDCLIKEMFMLILVFLCVSAKIAVRDDRLRGG